MFGRGKHESMSLAELLSKKNDEIDKLIESGKIPTEFTSAKELRKTAKADRQLAERCLNGERGAKALLPGFKGGGAQNYKNVPLKERVHPSEYKRILEREAKRQGLL